MTEVRKGYKRTDIGEIPIEWEVKRIRDIAEVSRGASPRPKGDPRYYGGNVPRLMVADVTRDYKYVTPKIDFLTEAGAKLSRPMPAGSFVVVCSGTVGVPAMLAVDACIHDGFLGLKNISKDCDKEFLFYCFSFLKSKFDSAATHGGVFTNLTTSIMNEFTVALPPIGEQKGIVAILSSVDEAIDKAEAIIEQIEKVKKGLMKQLLTEGVGHTKFKKTKIGEIPEEWEVKALEDFCEYVTYGFTTPMPTTEVGPFMITAKDVRDGKIQYETARKTDVQMYTNALTLKSKPSIGDILITKDGSLGRLAIVDREGICINQSVATIRLKQEASIMNKYLFYLLASPKIQKRILNDAGGSTIKHIYITKLAKMEVPIPKGLDEQNKVVTLLDLIEGKLEKEREKLTQFIAIRKGLMQSLLTGKVRVKVNDDEVTQE